MSDMHQEWVDASNYSQSVKKEDRIPRTWRRASGYLLITVTRHIHHPDTWLLDCRSVNLEMVDLNTDDVDIAKTRAIEVVRLRCSHLLEDIGRLG